MRYAIIGMGVAGIAAAEAIRSRGANGEIVMISDDPNGYYSRPGLAYYLTGEVEQKQLFPYPAAELKKLNLKYIGGRVTRIDATEHTLSIAPDKFLPYDRLLIATGASAMPIKTSGANLEGVVKLDHLDIDRR
jgi:NADPH-dependent 2,4-dienoyl-CoA reductase/sulfur reductase-like enzyme